MEPSEQDLSSLGRRVAALQDQAPGAHFDAERGLSRLLAVDLAEAKAADRASRRSRRWQPLAAVAAAALVLGASALAALVVTEGSRHPLRFETGAAATGLVGEWIAADRGDPRSVAFSDGSIVRLLAGARARVTSVDVQGAEVALEQGAIEVSVVHHDRSRWFFRAGPFEVRVVGTRFHVTWDPTGEQLELEVQEGLVAVSGPVVGTAHPVGRGQWMSVSAARHTLELRSQDAPRGVAVQGGVGPTEGIPADVAPASPSAHIAVAASVARPPEVQSAGPPRRDPKVDRLAAWMAPVGWRALVDQGRYKEALAAANRQGIDGICATGTVEDLRALGDAARLGGSTPVAVRALLRLRDRFPSAPDAPAAAFLLGRIAQDQSEDFTGAAEWFRQYLSESPSGEFAAEALGRLLEVEDKEGNDAAARRDAARYLAAHPEGPHAGYARTVIAGARRAP